MSLRVPILAAIPALLVFLVFRFWLGLPVPVAALAGALFGVLFFVLARVLYDDAEAELAAWRLAAPDLQEREDE